MMLDMGGEVGPVGHIWTTSQEGVCIEQRWVWRRIWIQGLEMHVRKGVTRV